MKKQEGQEHISFVPAVTSISPATFRQSHAEPRGMRKRTGTRRRLMRLFLCYSSVSFDPKERLFSRTLIYCVFVF